MPLDYMFTEPLPTWAVWVLLGALILAVGGYGWIFLSGKKK